MKELLRKQFLALRRGLSQDRRIEAAEQLLKTLDACCLPFKRIASFSSMKDEIDLSAFNVKLAKENRLLLPRRVENGLQYYQVSDLATLERTEGYLMEPNPALCIPAALSTEDLILVPGLAFDAEGFRLGYGKGHFDRFLAQHSSIPTAGVGFFEQKSEDPLPRDKWDLPINVLYLF